MPGHDTQHYTPRYTHHTTCMATIPFVSEYSWTVQSRMSCGDVGAKDHTYSVRGCMRTWERMYLHTLG
eukprot:m.660707 g.660707  ORF g.660707 m.660707 type:complete len:68 (-) comp22731_c0_seq12:1967-2170(-)